jgi:SAM-dependent methyltransferase
MGKETHPGSGGGRGKAKKAVLENQISLAYLLIALFFISASLFTFQVALTRVFSPMLRYHFVFLVISVAIFGLGIGGYIAYAYARKKQGRNLSAYLAAWPTVLAAALVLAFSLIYKLPFLHVYVLYGAIATLPFVAGGFFISLVFISYPLSSHRLYFADLLGAAAGGISAVVTMNRLGLTNTVLLAVGLALVSSLLLSVALLGLKQAIPHAIMVVLVTLVALYQPFVTEFERRFTGYFTSPLNSLFRFRQANEGHSIDSWSWDAYSRTDVINSAAEVSSKIISIDGESNSEMIQFDGHLAEVQELRSDLGYLPFGFGNTGKVLLIGPGGGKDILLALLGGSSEIHAVEINSGSVRMARKYAAFNGNIYDREEVTLHIQDGRNFVKQTNERYDVIYLAQVMTEVAETVGYALAENYIYTKEALQEYWNALNENGKLTFVLHGEHDLKRLLNTIVAAVTELGVSEMQLRNHLVIINRSDHSQPGVIHMPLVLIKKSPLTMEEIQQIRNLAAVAGNELLFLPDSAGSRGWGRLRASEPNLSGNKQLNMSATSDDRPYFFDFNPGVESGLLILLGMVVLIVLLFFRPAFNRNGLGRAPLYFVGLGLGFMLIEIPLVQKFTLLLGHPIRSFVITIPALLAGGGLGSLASNWKPFSLYRRYLPLLIVPVVVILVYLLLGSVVRDLITPSLMLRILFTVAVLLPLGFFLGMPFPKGIRMISSGKKRHTIPLMWGLNGTMSIAGSVLAVIVSMKMGFSYSLALGGLVYLLLFLFMPLQEKTGRLK